jgi:hypothetical protein
MVRFETQLKKKSTETKVGGRNECAKTEEYAPSSVAPINHRDWVSLHQESFHRERLGRRYGNLKSNDTLACKKNLTQHTESASLLRDCVVTKEDFDCAMQDVRDSLGDADWVESEDEQAEKEDSTTTEEENDDSTGVENEPEDL